MTTSATWRRCKPSGRTSPISWLRSRRSAAQRYVDRHRQRGKMLARERIEALVDPDTPLLELSPLAGWGSEFPIGAGVVNAIGVVAGVECAISATDMTYRGGSMNPRTVDKGQRFQEIVARNRLPWINLNESAGADLPHQADIFVRGGAGFKNHTAVVEARHPDDHRRLRPGDRGRRLHAGHERLHGVRQGPRHRLPRRSAAGEDGDRRDRRRGDARRGRDAQPRQRPRPTTSPSTSSTRSGSRATSCATSAGASSARDAPKPPTIRSTTRPS